MLMVHPPVFVKVSEADMVAVYPLLTTFVTELIERSYAQSAAEFTVTSICPVFNLDVTPSPHVMSYLMVPAVMAAQDVSIVFTVVPVVHASIAKLYGTAVKRH